MRERDLKTQLREFQFKVLAKISQKVFSKLIQNFGRFLVGVKYFSKKYLDFWIRNPTKYPLKND